jgi:hypothetical protein
MGLLGRTRRPTEELTSSDDREAQQQRESKPRPWGLARVVPIVAAKEVVNKSAEVRGREKERRDEVRGREKEMR